MSSFYQQAVACALGFLALVLGSLGAHGFVHDIVVSHNFLPQWDKAVFYQFTHVIVLLVLARTAPRALGPYLCFLAGIVFFCGSIYFRGYTGISLGPVTPFGGLCFMAGWIWLAFSKPAA